MEILTILAVRTIVFVLALLGIIFHVMAVLNLQSANRMEESLGTKFGLQKKITPAIEKVKMNLHERLIKSKIYNICAIIFLILLLILVSRM